jgi:hypothetical protein
VAALATDDGRAGRLATATVFALEPGLSRELRRGWRLELSLGPQLALEPRLQGPQRTLVIAPYLGLYGTAGLRWF